MKSGKSKIWSKNRFFAIKTDKKYKVFCKICSLLRNTML